MVFNSLTFMLFFAIVLLLHNLPFAWKIKKANLLVASYLFYAAWSPPFVILLWGTTVLDWFVARWMARTEAVRKRRLLLLVSLAGNLGLLGYFKYGNFLLQNFTALLQSIGVDYQPAVSNIILPVGISFYTFVTLSYTIDVFRHEIPPSKSFLDYALLVTFFPHLVAGPILRAADFLPQCAAPRRANAQQLGWGLSLMVIGLFEKVILADGLVAPVADRVYTAPYYMGMWGTWVGTLAFASQIFFDFDGYSLCAIGSAMSLGFAFPDNFRFPYAAIGFSDFWRRWHLSLSAWLRDYLYVSLGGNRAGPRRTYVNLMLTMLIGGLWHGASWHFVFWGGLHGLFLVVERLLRTLFSDLVIWKNRLIQGGLALLTFFFVCIAWVFFRASDMSRAVTILGQMFSGNSGERAFDTNEARWVLLVTFGLLVLHWKLRDSTLEEATSHLPMWGRSVMLALMLLAIFYLQGDSRAFIYFQF